MRTALPVLTLILAPGVLLLFLLALDQLFLIDIDDAVPLMLSAITAGLALSGVVLLVAVLWWRQHALKRLGKLIGPVFRPPISYSLLLLFGLVTFSGTLVVFLLALEMRSSIPFGVADDLIIGAVVVGVWLPGVVVMASMLLRQHRNEQVGIRARQALGKLHGLPYSTHITFDDLDPCFGLPLFYFVWGRILFGGYSLRGWVEGQEVFLFDLAYNSAIRTPDNRCLPRRLVQTLVVFAEAGNLPDFRLGPVNSDWEMLMPEGPVADIDVNDWALDVGEPGELATRVFGRDAAEVRRLFTPARLAELGNLAGWVIECRGMCLLVYRFGERVAASELHLYFQRALAIQRALTRREETEPSAAVQSTQFLALPPRQAGAE
jgi:hypothetical protein